MVLLPTFSPAMNTECAAYKTCSSTNRKASTGRNGHLQTAVRMKRDARVKRDRQLLLQLINQPLGSKKERDTFEKELLPEREREKTGKLS